MLDPSDRVSELELGSYLDRCFFIQIIANGVFVVLLQGSEPEDMNTKSPETENQQKKTCADCGTSKTPLWRGGPAGPKVMITFKIRPFSTVDPFFS